MIWFSKQFERGYIVCHFLIGVVIRYNLSIDVSGIQWNTSCHKNRMTTCVITLWRERVTSLITSVPTMRFLLEILSVLKAIQSNLILKGHMINRILHSWSIHMNIMKLAEGSFHKFHMK